MENAATSLSTRPPSGTQWMIAAGGHEAVLVEVGGGLRAYRSDGVDHLDGYGLDEICPGGAGQLLAPWPNRIRDGRYAYGGDSYQLDLSEPSRHNAIHGLVRWRSWRRVEQSESAVVLECDLMATPGYPWPLVLRTRWSVGPDGLVAEHSATNVGSAPAPFGLAAHPYLRLPGVPISHIHLRVPGRSRLLVDGRLLPIGEAKVADGEFDFTAARPIGDAVLDTCFGDVNREPDGRSWVQLSTEDGSAAVGVWADEAFRWWQIFTGDTLTGERARRSVAVEPMTCPPDAFRSGRDVDEIAPGGTWRGSWGVRPGGAGDRGAA